MWQKDSLLSLFNPIHVLLHCLGFSEMPSPLGSEEIHFAAGGGVSEDGTRFAHELVVTTSEEMLHRVHGHILYVWCILILVVGTVAFRMGF